MNLETLTTADLFKEICDIAKEQGIDSPENWRELVNETVDSHLELGELDKDEDLEGMKATLIESWAEYEREFGQTAEDQDANLG